VALGDRDIAHSTTHDHLQDKCLLRSGNLALDQHLHLKECASKASVVPKFDLAMEWAVDDTGPLNEVPRCPADSDCGI
jgi:hypothetical protein